MWFCYMVKCSDSSYYVGITKDLESRVSEHNAGRGSAYTAARRPVRLLWYEEHETRSSATKREREIKGWRRAKKETLTAGSARLGSGVRTRRD
jgi:putative endonuclease